MAAGKFLDISLSRVQVLTSQISSGLSLNTTARYCLKQMRIYSSKSPLSILLHMCCSQSTLEGLKNHELGEQIKSPSDARDSLELLRSKRMSEKQFSSKLTELQISDRWFCTITVEETRGIIQREQQHLWSHHVQPELMAQNTRKTQDCRLDRVFSLLQMHGTS